MKSTLTTLLAGFLLFSFAATSVQAQWWHRHHRHRHHRVVCRWVPPHWKDGYFIPGHRFCWRVWGRHHH